MPEYIVGDIAHLNKDLRARGFLNYDTEQEKYKDILLKSQSPVEIKAILSNAKSYSVLYDDGIYKYFIESITEKYLYTQASWKKAEEQNRILAKLMKERG